VLGALAVSSAILFSWGAVAQPVAPDFRPGIVPAPAGSAGRYELRHPRSRALFTDRGVELSLPSRTQEARALGWSVAGGRAVTPRAEKPREAKLHRLVGPREAWEREVPTYGGLRYPGVLPGVDLWFAERVEGVEYGFRAERGADLRRVTLEYAGAKQVRVVERGRALEVDLGEGVLREEGLRCWQEAAEGSQRAVGCRFTHAHPVGLGRWAYSIEVDVEDPARPVVVDPLVLWNTYLGGTSEFAGLRVLKQNAAGDIFAAGGVGSAPDVPQEGSSRFGVLGGGLDALVARFKADGTLVWWTLFGGKYGEYVNALVIGDSQELYVGGITGSPELQWLLPDGGTGISRTYSVSGVVDGFVARLDPSGKQLEWFLHVGGEKDDAIMDVLPAADGRLFVSGATDSSRMMDAGFIGPDAGPVLTEEGFITRLDPSQRKAEWTLLLQGPGDEAVLGLTPRSDGTLYASGYYSDDPGGVTNAFVLRVSGVNGDSPSVSAPVRIGGNGSERAVAVTPPVDGGVGRVLVWGSTTSTNFPGHTPVDGGSDLFVSVVGDDGGTLSLQSTALLGGSGKDELNVVKAISDQHFYLGGFTTSPDLRADGGFDMSLENNSQGDGFVARVRLDAQPAFEWVSYVGGTGKDQVFALEVDRQNPNLLYLGGFTTSLDLGYTDAGFDTSPNGGGLSNGMFLLAVDLGRSPGQGTSPDAGVGDGGTGAVSPLGWSCGASGSSGGVAALALGSLAGLVLLASRRRPRA
jgi:hypothetical protein